MFFMSVVSFCCFGVVYKELNVNMKGYDFIGDIYGYVDKLVVLFELMGYWYDGVGYCYFDWQVIFFGDFIDCGF